MPAPISRRNRFESSARVSVLTGECEQLADEVRCAIGVLLDLHDVGKRRVARLMPQQQQVAETDHRRQQIVEIVGDTAGQLSDGQHLLGLGELNLETLLVRRFDQMEHEAGARGVFEGTRVECPCAIPAARQRHLDRGGSATLPRRDQLGRHVGSFRHAHEVDERHAAEFRAIMPDEGREGWIGLRYPQFVVQKSDADRRLLEEPLEAQLGSLERLLPLALGPEIAHDRAGHERAAHLPGHDALRDLGLDRPPADAAKHGFSPLCRYGIGEGRVAGRTRHRHLDEKVVQAPVAAHQIFRSDAEEARQGAVDEEEAAVGIHGVEP